jgi:hypothetical protein
MVALIGGRRQKDLSHLSQQIVPQAGFVGSIGFLALRGREARCVGDHESIDQQGMREFNGTAPQSLAHRCGRIVGQSVEPIAKFKNAFARVEKFSPQSREMTRDFAIASTNEDVCQHATS